MKKQTFRLLLILIALQVSSYAQRLPIVGTILPKSTKNVYDTLLAPGTPIIITNTGAADLKFIRASSATYAGSSSEGLTIASGQTSSVVVEDLGGTPDDRFLNVNNNTLLKAGAYTIDIKFPPQTGPVPCPAVVNWNYMCNTAVDINGQIITDNYIYSSPLNTRIGIGTISPLSGYKFHLVGSALMQGDAKISGNVGIGVTPDSRFNMTVSDPVAGKLMVQRGAGTLTRLELVAEENLTYIQSEAFTVHKPFSLRCGGQDVIYMTPVGNVGIGTTAPGSYKLAVNGDIRAKRITVETGWSDFVFAKDYKLMSLKEVEEFINQNHHLPEIPPASEVETNGADLGEMVKLQMAKIEQLTLYIIQQQKEIDAIKKELKKQ